MVMFHYWKLSAIYCLIVYYLYIFMQMDSTLTRFKNILNPKRNSLNHNHDYSDRHKQHISQMKHASMTEIPHKQQKPALAITINNFKQMKMPDAFSIRLSQLPTHNWVEASPKKDTKHNYKRKLGKKYMSKDIDVQGLIFAIQRNKWLMNNQKNDKNSYLITKQMKAKKRYQISQAQQQKIQKQLKYSFSKYENWSEQPLPSRKYIRSRQDRHLSNLFPRRNQNNQLTQTGLKLLKKKISIGESLAPWDTPDVI